MSLEIQACSLMRGMHSALVVASTAIKPGLIAVFVEKLVRVGVHHHLSVTVLVFTSTAAKQGTLEP